ncbi:hypothetical protein GJ496_005995 [Pomphorhynchus laevis]|nr:hypothetical protein GJ496_005995 [Pomphorhynchus laevis]
MQLNRQYLQLHNYCVGITEINNECKMLIYEDINQYLFNYQSSKLIECNRTSMEWVLANYPELIADETIVQQRIKPGILSLKSKGNALRKRFFISDGTLLVGVNSPFGQLATLTIWLHSPFGYTELATL